MVLIGSIGAAAALLLSLADAPAARLPSKTETWIRLQTAHFTIYSNGSESKAKDIGLEFERLRAALGLLKPNLRINTPLPTTVYVFRNDSTFEPYKPLYRGKPMPIGGLFQPTTDGNFIAVTATWNVDPRPRVYHEYLHDFVSNNLPPQPLWFSEGLAEFYSTFRATDTEVQIGRPVDDHVVRMRQEMLLSLERLFAVDRDSPEYNEQSRQGVFYAESWALVHYLMVGDPKRTAQLAQFLVLLAQGKPQREAFQEAFGAPDTSKMLTDLVGYARGHRFLYMRIPLKDLKVESETTKTALGWEEAVVALGNLLAHGPEEALPAAEAHFQAAVASKAAGADALAGLGFVRMRQDRNAEAQEYLQRAVAADSRDFQAHFRYGQLRMRALSHDPIPASGLEGDRRKTVEEARAAFRRSIELNASFPEAHAALGQTYLFESEGKAADGIPELELAVKLLPSRADLALNLASLYARQGEEQKSEALLKTLGPAAKPILDQKRVHSDWNQNVNRVNSLLTDGKEDEAIALMEQIVANAADSLKPALQEELEKLCAGAARNRSVRKYNQANEHWNRGELKAALAGFEEVASTATDASLAKAAQDKAKLAREALARKKRR
jgi:tetratricopeptide (TPR) repeat protein